MPSQCHMLMDKGLHTVTMTYGFGFVYCQFGNLQIRKQSKEQEQMIETLPMLYSAQC